MGDYSCRSVNINQSGMVVLRLNVQEVPDVVRIRHSWRLFPNTTTEVYDHKAYSHSNFKQLQIRTSKLEAPTHRRHKEKSDSHIDLQCFFFPYNFFHKRNSMLFSDNKCQIFPA